MNIQKLFLTAGLLSTMALTSCQNNSNENTAGEKKVAAPMAAMDVPADSGDCPSTSIPVDSANKMLTSYITSIGGPTQQDNLFSLIVDAQSLRCYLSNPQIKNVKLMFAHTLEYINSGHAGQPAGYGSGKLTLIIAGYDANGNYVLDNKQGVEDNASPCPYSCPTTGSASSNTINVSH